MAKSIKLSELKELIEGIQIEALEGVVIEGDIEIEISSEGQSGLDPTIANLISQESAQAATHLMNIARILGYPVSSAPPSIPTTVPVSSRKIEPKLTELIQTKFEVGKIEEWKYPIQEVTIGATSRDGGSRKNVVTIGGEKALPFYFDTPMPHRCYVTLDVFDMPIGMAKAVKVNYEDVINDPSEWAKKAVREFGADMVTIHLISTDPYIKDTPAREAAKVVEEVLQAVDVPVVIGGSGNPDKDPEVLEKAAEAAEGERCLIASANLDMDYQRIAKAAKDYGHVILSWTQLQINSQKELNRKLMKQCGIERKDIVMDPTTAALGYGLDFAYTNMERIRLAGLIGDEELTFPMSSGTTNCVPGDTELLFEDGSMMEIKKLVDTLLPDGIVGGDFYIPESDIKVISWNEYSTKVGKVTAIQRYPSPKKLVEIETKSGFKLKFTPNHEILVDKESGPMWIMASDIKKGDMLYSPITYPIKTEDVYCIDLLPEDFTLQLSDDVKEKLKNIRYLNGVRESVLTGLYNPSISEFKKMCNAIEIDWNTTKEKIRKIGIPKAGKPVELMDPKVNEDLMYLLGLLISDGHVVKKGYPMIFVNKNKKLAEKFKTVYKSLFGNREVTMFHDGKHWRIEIRNAVLYNIALKLGVIKEDSTKGDMKRIFKFSESLIASFLKGYFDGDGYIKLEEGKKRVLIKYATSNPVGARIIHLLLRRLGIASMIKQEGDNVFRVYIYDKDNILKFMDMVGSNHPNKIERFKLAREQLNSIENIYKSTSNLAPLHCGKLLKNLQVKYGIPNRNTYKNLWRIQSQKSRCTRPTLQKILKEVRDQIPKDDPDLKKLIEYTEMKAFLDEVVNIKYVASEEKWVYDITVDKDHSFIPNGGYVVSNSWGAREAWMVSSPIKEDSDWGPREYRGPIWEIVTGLTLSLAGVDLFMMMHPTSVQVLKETTQSLIGLIDSEPVDLNNWIENVQFS